MLGHIVPPTQLKSGVPEDDCSERVDGLGDYMEPVWTVIGKGILLISLVQRNILFFLVVLCIVLFQKRWEAVTPVRYAQLDICFEFRRVDKG